MTQNLLIVVLVSPTQTQQKQQEEWNTFQGGEAIQENDNRHECTRVYNAKREDENLKKGSEALTYRIWLKRADVT